MPRAEIVAAIQREIKAEMLSVYPEVSATEHDDLMAVLTKSASAMTDRVNSILASLRNTKNFQKQGDRVTECRWRKGLSPFLEGDKGDRRVTGWQY